MPFLTKYFTRTMDKHQKENIRAMIYVHLFCKKYCEKIISGKRLKNKEKRSEIFILFKFGLNFEDRYPNQ